MLTLVFLPGTVAQGAPPAPSVGKSTGGVAEKPRAAKPWGDLEFFPTYLEVPDSVLANVPKPNSVPRWSFPGASDTSLRSLFTRAELPASMQESLLDPRRWNVQDGVVTVFPSVSDIEAMTPEMRQIVYAELAKSELNEFHRNPLLIIGGLEEWLRGSGLSPALQTLVRRMIYQRGRILVLSDLRALLSHAQSDREVRQIFKAVSRTQTLVVNLKLSSTTNVDQLVDYWSGGHEASDIIPLLESLAGRSPATTLDVIHLLPPLARRELYTYPAPELAIRGRMPDCHWTSLNFFARVPQNYFLDTRLASLHVNEHYSQVAPPYRFGDVLFFTSPEGGTIHSCVYLAEDIVFTKNGENALAPWILMHLNTVQDIYLGSPEFVMQGYRENRTKVPIASAVR